MSGDDTAHLCGFIVRCELRHEMSLRTRKIANLLHRFVQKSLERSSPHSPANPVALAPLPSPPPLHSPMTPLYPPSPLFGPPLASRTNTRNLHTTASINTRKVTAINAHSPLGHRLVRHSASPPGAATALGYRSGLRPSCSGVRTSASHSEPFCGVCLEMRR